MWSADRTRRRGRPVTCQRRAKGSIGKPPARPLFRWECGPSGDIAWVEGAPRGALIGRSIARVNGDGVDQGGRARLRDAGARSATQLFTLGGEGSVSGEWKISGVPAFEPADGRFAGYRGVALRETPPAAEHEVGCTASCLPTPTRCASWSTRSNSAQRDHRIRGDHRRPVSRAGRSRVSRARGEIVAQARLLVTAIDDLDSPPRCIRLAAHVAAG